MQQNNQKASLLGSLNEIKKEIGNLRDTLNEIDKQKEAWFSKKEEFSKNIKWLIKDVKGKREKRDLLTKEVKEKKEKRKELNDKIKDNISKLNLLNLEKNSLIKKYNIKSMPSEIKETIDKIEFKIETEAMSFEKEQKLRKLVKDMQKKLEDSKILNDVTGKISSLYKETSCLRREAEDIHKSLQETAKQSQSLHEEVIHISKEIDNLKEKEEESLEKFVEFKKKFNDINWKLKEKLVEANLINTKIGNIREERKLKKKQEEDKILKTLEEAVQEKIRKGQKLTTEDLLVYQKFEKS